MVIRKKRRQIASQRLLRFWSRTPTNALPGELVTPCDRGRATEALKQATSAEHPNGRRRTEECQITSKTAILPVAQLRGAFDSFLQVDRHAQVFACWSWQSALFLPCYGHWVPATAEARLRRHYAALATHTQPGLSHVTIWPTKTGTQCTCQPIHIFHAWQHSIMHWKNKSIPKILMSDRYKFSSRVAMVAQLYRYGKRLCNRSRMSTMRTQTFRFFVTHSRWLSPRLQQKSSTSSSTNLLLNNNAQ